MIYDLKTFDYALRMHLGTFIYLISMHINICIFNTYLTRNTQFWFFLRLDFFVIFLKILYMF